jgi:hypothetical protein
MKMENSLVQQEMAYKKCPKCNETKELTSDNFYNSNQTKSGFKVYCKPCVNRDNYSYDKKNPDQLIKRVLKSRNRCKESKARHVTAAAEWRNANRETYKNGVLKRKYGITFLEFEEMFNSQEGKCKICYTELELLSKITHVDHCHTSNKVRGILCGSCNVALGHMKDSIAALESAIVYLKNNN